MFVKIPQPTRSRAGEEARGNILKEASFGLKYILKRPSLLQLQLLFLLCNFFFSIAVSVRAPYILARTGNDQLIFGSTQSAAAIGGLVGGLLMGIWGGPKRRIHGVLAGWAISCLLGAVIFGIGQTTTVWIVSSFVGTLFAPVINGSNQAIWQSKVPPDLQGRVFAIRRLIAWFVLPLSNALAGPLADNVLEPAMMPGGALTDRLWRAGGGRPGGWHGIDVCAGGGMASLIAILAYTIPTLREVEATPARP